MARFNLSPSRLARFYFHECDRYLRYAAATKEQRAVDGIPPIELDHNLVTKAVLESGYAWEREIVEIVARRSSRRCRRHRLRFRSTSVATPSRRPSSCSRQPRPGSVIYQPTPACARFVLRGVRPRS